MRQRFIKALSLAISLITFLSALLLPASAAYVAPIINPMLDTYVVDDLVNMQYDPSNYPLDPSATHLQLIHFLEYGYSRTDSRYYGLYIYLYNPTGKELELEGSYLQMSYGLGSKDYSKYPLSVVSYSIDTGNKFVFYKLKVNGINNVWRNINYASRVYNLANLELLYKGETEVVTKSWEQNAAKTRKNVWTYTGFQKGFGSNTEAGTLCYDVDELDTIPVTMHDASWMSDTSSLGDDYRWEVKSYFFSIPISYIRQYGNLTVANTNDTDGLYSVQGEYYKYGVNGLIVPDQEWYNLFDKCDNRFLGSGTMSSWPEFVVLDYINLEGIINEVDFDLTFNWHDKKVPFNVYAYKSKFKLMQYLLLSQGSSPYMDNSTFTDLWTDAGRPKISSSSYLYMGSKTSGIGTRVLFDVSVKDKDLSSALTTYASSKKDGIGKWLDKVFNNKMYTDEDGYMNCKPLIQINSNDVSEAFKESVQGKNLYLDYNSYTELQEFYSENSAMLSNGLQANDVYLMRLSVEPYYESKVFLNNDDTVIIGSDTGYYYEKIIHTNVDIFSFTFQRADGSFVTVPVDCDPVDNLGSVVEGNNKDDSNPNKYPDDPSPGEIIVDGAKKLRDWLDSLKGIVILTGITLGSIFILGFVIIFWKHLEPLFQRAGKLLGAAGKGIGSFFGGLFRILGSILKLLLYPLIFIWNVAVMILSIWFPFVSILRINMSLGGKSGGSDDSKYYYEDRKYKQAEENRKQAEEKRRQERHEAELKAIEHRSNGSQRKSDSKPSYGDADDFIQAALERAEREIK